MTMKTTIVPVIGIQVTAVETVVTSGNSGIVNSVHVWTHQRKHLVAPGLASVVPKTMSVTNGVMTRTITVDAAGMVAIVVELVEIRGSTIIVVNANVKTRR